MAFRQSTLESVVTIMSLKNFYKGKTIFITGHTGFKGTWLTKILLNLGAKVIGFSKFSESDLKFYNSLKLTDQLTSIDADILHYDELLNALVKSKPDIVFHLAAQPIVKESYTNPKKTFETNIMGTVNILEASRYIDTLKSIINVTTDKVYENKEWYWPYKETDRLVGKDPYSNSKSCSELISFSYRNSFFLDSKKSLSTLRSGNVFGGGDFSKDRLIPDIMKSVYKNKQLTLRNPTSTRPYQHVLDTLNGYLIIAKNQFNDTSYQGAYNFGPNVSESFENLTIVKKFQQVLDGKLKFISDSTQTFIESNNLHIDSSKSKKVLGWKPKIEIDEAIKITVDLYDAINQNSDINLIMDEQISKYLGIE